jgi:hypothetical protein
MLRPCPSVGEYIIADTCLQCFAQQVSYHAPTYDGKPQTGMLPHASPKLLRKARNRQSTVYMLPGQHSSQTVYIMHEL